MSPVVGKKTLRDIRDLLANAKSSDGPLRNRVVNEIDCILKPKKFVRLAKARKATKKEERLENWATLREKVRGRSNDYCENMDCTILCPANGSADHMFGGGGRRISLESLFTVWFLCSHCHGRKTNNKPSSSYWLERFIDHCERRSQYGDVSGYRHAASIAQRRLDSIRISEALPHGRKSK